MPGIDGGLVVAQVVDMLRGVMAVPVGHGSLPSPTEDYEASAELLDAGALVVKNAPAGDTSMAHDFIDQPNAMAEVRILLTGVGGQADQAEAIATLAGKAVTDKGDTGGFIHTLTVPGHTVQRRRWLGTTTTDALGSFNAGVIVGLTVAVA